jgi:predicted Zn-dependent protease
VQVRNRNYPQKQYAGLALPRHGGHWSVRLGNGQLSRRQKRQLACHELGHTLGIPHTEAASCMNVDALTHLPGAYADA